MSRRGGPSADPYFYRPDLDPANANYLGSWVYLVCLDPPIDHPELGPHASCSHYTGQSWDLLARQAAHGTSEGARLLAYQRARGGGGISPAPGRAAAGRNAGSRTGATARSCAQTTRPETGAA